MSVRTVIVACMRGDGDGWVVGADGSRRWGRFGAAGLVLRVPAPDGSPLVLLQHRVWWSHQGGTWSVPGGARDSAEAVEDTALREAAEEAGIDAGSVTVRACRVTASFDNDRWTYTSVLAEAAEPPALVAGGESAELRWVPEAEVERYRLHPGFAQSWPDLRVREIRGLAAGEPRGLPRLVELADGFGWLRSEIPLSPGCGSDGPDRPRPASGRSPP